MSSTSEGAGVLCVPQDRGWEHLASRTAPVTCCCAHHSTATGWQLPLSLGSALYEVMGWPCLRLMAGVPRAAPCRVTEADLSWWPHLAACLSLQLLAGPQSA